MVFEKLKTNKRGVFTLRGFIIATLVAFGIMLALATLTRGASETYGVGDPSVLDKYNRTAELADKTDDIKDQLQNDENEVIGFVTKSTKASGNVIAFGVDTIASMFTTAQQDIPYLDWLINLVINILTISLFIALIALVIRWYA